MTGVAGHWQRGAGLRQAGAAALPRDKERPARRTAGALVLAQSGRLPRPAPAQPTWKRLEKSRGSIDWVSKVGPSVRTEIASWLWRLS